jgi:poly-gamma-glutamate synthesis protein (capsule biosynthesis protein)
VAAAGDTVLGFNLEAHFDEQLEAGAVREQLWPLYFSGVAEVLHRADAAVVNLECPFTERGVMIPKNFNFRARLELIEILKAGGIDLVTLANNHIMDYGVIGMEDTFRTLKEAGIAHFGAGMTLGHARKPAIIERQGLRIGFLGYYFQTAADMLEPRELFATNTTAGVAGCYVNPRCIRQQVTEDVSALVPSVDAVIVYFHWGKEGSQTVQEYQIRLAHLCIDLGCKAVLGAHPHRFQGVEVYREAPIFYSLGNFVYGGRKDPPDKLSAIALLRLSKDQPVTTELVPIQFTRWPEAPFQPIVLAGAERDQALERIAALSSGFPATLPMLESYRKLGAPGIQLPP